MVDKQPKLVSFIVFHICSSETRYKEIVYSSYKMSQINYISGNVGFYFNETAECGAFAVSLLT